MPFRHVGAVSSVNPRGGLGLLLFFVQFIHTLWHNLYSPLSSFSTLSTHNLYLQFLRTKGDPVAKCEQKCLDKLGEEAQKLYKKAVERCEKKCDDDDKKCEKDCKRGKSINEKKM